MRLQGADWYKMKKYFKLVGYYTSNKGNIKAIVKDKRNEKRYCHWLSDSEKQSFLPVMKNYKCFDEPEVGDNSDKEDENLYY